MQRADGLKVGLIGPLPPPNGGMANQTCQLVELLRGEGVVVTVVQVNEPYKPQWIGHISGLRAIVRLIPYLWNLYKTANRVDLFHVMANSGWSWHLFVAPAVWMARMCEIPVVINYRGGGAETFFRSSFNWISPTLQSAAEVIVPSGFLQDVFNRFGVSAKIVPNIINLDRFRAFRRSEASQARQHVIITRNLEPIYGIDTALCAFSIVLQKHPETILSVAGSGCQREELENLTQELAISHAVTFTGRLEVEQMADLYCSADIMLNPSKVDNMPNSILEALASGVPVVSTSVGGIPYMVENEKTALLVPPEDVDAMANTLLRILEDKLLAATLSENGRVEVEHYSWNRVREILLGVYFNVLERHNASSSVGSCK